MQSHGRIQNLINFADRKNNFEMIVMHYLSEESYEKALDYLKKVKDEKVAEVVYKYSHIFFRYETEKTVNLLIRNIRDFKPIKLMAGLMNIPDNKRVHGIELLRYCIEECRSKERSLHNILIFFYATSHKDHIPELITMMRKGRLDFDFDFGLRLFKNYKIIEAQIIVYGKMYLYSDAVSLALEYNKEEMAK
jgi:vacuolar protein sorting-associated protein 18